MTPDQDDPQSADSVASSRRRLRNRAPKPHNEPRQLLTSPLSFGTDAVPSMRLRVHEEANWVDLSAAAYAHCNIRIMRAALALHGLSQNKYAEATGQGSRHVSTAMTGTRLVNTADLARVMAAIWNWPVTTWTDLLADPSDVAAMLKRARIEHMAATRAAQSGQRRQYREAMNLLTALGNPPAIVIHEPLDEAESEAYARLSDEVPTPLHRAMTALHTRGAPTWWRQTPPPLDPDDIDICVRLARPQYGERGQVAGTPGTTWVDVLLELDPSWLSSVFDAGYAVLDDWFVVHVDTIGENGKPSRVVVIDAEPDVRMYPEELIPAEPDLMLTLQFATVSWDLAEHPTVTIDNTVKPQGVLSWLLNPLTRST